MAVHRRFLKALITLFTLLLLLPLLLFTFYRREEPETVRFAVLVTLDDPFVSSFRVGDELIEGATKQSLGTVTEMQVSPAYEETENGVFVLPDKSRVILTLTAKGSLREGKITVGGTSLLTGKRLSLHGRGVAEGVCLWARREGNV